MGTLVQDFRYGIRILLKNPGFTVVAVLTLALGIGANTAIFSVVNTVLLRPLPYPHADRIVVVGQEWMGGAGDFSPADFLDVQSQNHTFEHLAATREWNFNLSAGDRPERIIGDAVSTNLFSLLGVEPVLGRGFVPEDGGHRTNRVVVLSYGLWQRHFGGNASVLGEKLDLNGEPFTIVGVMPRGFAYPEGAELWVPPRYAVPAHPLRLDVDPATMRGSHYFESIARLRPHVTLDETRADLAVIFKNVARAHSDSDLKDGKPWVNTLHEEEVGNVRPALLVLLGAVGLVLLIACANVASLIMARGVSRRKELAVREALGAGRARVIRQLLTESMLLALLGGGLGIFLAFWGFAPLAALVPGELKGFAQLSVDLRVLSFTVALSLLAGLVFGLAPALTGARPKLFDTLKEGGRSSTFGRHRGQEILVVAETAIALVLLVGAGLLLKSFVRILSVDEGFDPDHVLTLQIFLPQARYPEPQSRNNFVGQILTSVKALPGVEAASVATRLPLNPGGSSRGIIIEGRTYPPERQGEEITPSYSVASPDFFSALRIPLLKGRFFADADDARSAHVCIINKTMAKTFWPGEDPVGKRIRTDTDEAWMQIVGVVGDVQQHQLGEPVRSMFYAPYTQDPWPFMDIAVRTSSEPASLAAPVERAVLDLDGTQPVYNVRTMQEVVSRSVAGRRFNVVLLGLFAALALCLTAIGIFGVISFAVTQRTHEIGIRIALGAERRDVLRLVVGHGIVLTLIGLGLGVAGAFVLTRFLSSLLFAVKATDPVTFVSVSIMLFAVALLASYIPARRATRVDPMVALRYE
jgi:putative ABC transport system permease protein